MTTHYRFLVGVSLIASVMFLDYPCSWGVAVFSVGVLIIFLWVMVHALCVRIKIQRVEVDTLNSDWFWRSVAPLAEFNGLMSTVIFYVPRHEIVRVAASPAPIARAEVFRRD